MSEFLCTLVNYGAQTLNIFTDMVWGKIQVGEMTNSQGTAEKIQGYFDTFLGEKNDVFKKNSSRLSLQSLVSLFNLKQNEILTLPIRPAREFKFLREFKKFFEPFTYEL